MKEKIGSPIFHFSLEKICRIEGNHLILRSKVRMTLDVVYLTSVYMYFAKKLFSSHLVLYVRYKVKLLRSKSRLECHIKSAESPPMLVKIRSVSKVRYSLSTVTLCLRLEDTSQST